MSAQIIHVDFHRKLPDLAPVVPNVPVLCKTLRHYHINKLTPEHLRYIDKPIMMRRLHGLLKCCEAVDQTNQEI